MKGLFSIFIIVFLMLIISCHNSNKCPTAKDKNVNSIFQISNPHGNNLSDSVVLTNSDNPKSGIYNKISIFRKKKLVFEFTEKNLEVIGMPYSIFVEHEILYQKAYFYIFKISNTPSPNKYLIVKVTPEKTFLFGITEPNSAQIFGDIDNDEKFEIGGWTDWCEEDDTHKCPDLSLYKIFKVDQGFPTDTTLTNYFKHFLN